MACIGTSLFRSWPPRPCRSKTWAGAHAANHTFTRRLKRVFLHGMVIWSNTKFPSATMDRLRAGIGSHQLIQAVGASAVNLDAGKPDPQLERAQIAFGQPDPTQIIQCPSLRWVQLTTAGYTRY